MQRAAWPLIACCLLAVAPLGCARYIQPQKSPLAPARMSPDSVALEIFFIRCPFDDPQANVDLWDDVDEQRWSPEQRRQWADNGFRLGVIQGRLPQSLEQLMGIKSAAPATAVATDNQAPADSPDTGALAEQQVSLDQESPVTRRLLQLRAAQRSEIVASGIYPSWPLLFKEQGQLRGETYHQAQGVMGLKSYPQGDGRVRLEVLPELHHGEPRQTFVGSQGMFRLEAGRARKVFDHLRVETTLAPGELLVFSSIPALTGSAGHYFFTERHSGPLEQKLLLIRVAQTQYNDLFGETLILPLESD